MAWWCWHDYSPWKTYAVHLIKHSASLHGSFSIPASETRQVRRCEKCRKEWHRMVPNANGCSYDGPILDEAEEPATASVNPVSPPPRSH